MCLGLGSLSRLVSPVHCPPQERTLTITLTLTLARTRTRTRTLTLTLTLTLNLRERARRLAHDVEVGRVEGERGGGQAVRDEVDPEQLDGHEGLGQAEGVDEEDARHLVRVRVRVRVRVSVRVRVRVSVRVRVRVRVRVARLMRETQATSPMLDEIR